MSPGTLRPILVVSLLAVACSSPAPAPSGGVVAAAEVKAAPTPAPEAGRSDLPAELGEAELREAVEPAKVAARRTCNGVDRGGERIEVELTIAGSSGVVSHTSVWHDGGNPALATCVANELARAVFKPTRRASTRTTVSVTF